ncbi:helix-turn-helix transcriptional regulator [Stackebrandtia nassauensis]|uniref:Transcriptional regulator, XRE family n=1 Tax=Stackebrandtia nassauensis (strain DSM 44728 / CIP 108903 / NRRL B-16338 / NBRC 102104 / LLR-40K-21) TaxID=446470 RepID=D3Q0G4_STANL|nr:helix-turn-helix transcriptional regulator [Stackebrandtia nassauensis]ADD41700.1 transcriptional regulator, XRE family [Stackebrandtia nassauensis DSM 44728]
MASKRSRLAQRRKAAGFSQEKLAERLGVERSTVVRWETAETEPQPWLRLKLAQALGITTDDLHVLLDDVEYVTAGPSDRMDYVLEHPASVDLVAVAYLHERVRQLDESYDRSPSTALLGPAGQIHGQVAFLREQAKNPRVRKSLFEVEAESATVMGQLVWDVSQRRDHLGPIRYLDEAVNAAQQVRDPCVEAYAILRKSYVALYGENDPIKGLMVAQEAADVAEPCSPALNGLAMLHVAEGYAMSGNLNDCERALRAAEAQFDRVDDADVAAEYYSINEFTRLAGSCYLFLGLPERAEPILTQTVDALAGKKKSQAIALANLTLSLIRQRKLDEAADAMHRTIDAVELTRGGGGLNLAFAAGRELWQWRDQSWVGDINDRLLALMATI